MATKMKNTHPNETSFPELTDDQLDRMRPAREVMPQAFFEAVARRQGQRGPGKKPTKEHVTMRLEASVLDAYRSKFPDNWREQMEKVLAAAIRPKKRIVRVRKVIVSAVAKRRKPAAAA